LHGVAGQDDQDIGDGGTTAARQTTVLTTGYIDLTRLYAGPRTKSHSISRIINSGVIAAS
jgi:hypothetical protein